MHHLDAKKRLEKKLDGNYTRMLIAISNRSRREHPTKHQLYGHLPPITKTIQVRRTKLAGHCWRRRDELISDVLLWTPTYGRAKAGWPARKYIQQLREDKGCSPEDLPEAMNDREKWRERVRDILASGTTWWWWLIICVLTVWWSQILVLNSNNSIQQYSFICTQLNCSKYGYVIWYLSLPPTRQDSIQGQWPEVRLQWGFRGGEGRARAKIRTMLICAAHRPT